MSKSQLPRAKKKEESVDTKGIDNSNEPRAHNVVDALFQHFKKWHPEVIQKCPQNIKDASNT